MREPEERAAASEENVKIISNASRCQKHHARVRIIQLMRHVLVCVQSLRLRVRSLGGRIRIRGATMCVSEHFQERRVRVNG